MAPPPVPVDPAIHSWRPSNTAVSPGLALDCLLQLPPRYSDRQNLPGRSNLDAFPRELQLPAMKQNPAEPDPLMRFWNEPGPWTSQRIGGEVRQTPAHTHFTGFGDPTRRSPHALPYDFPSPPSEVGSSTTGRHPLDSGYGGSRSLATTSARSVDHFDQSRSCQSISGDVQDFHLYPEEVYQESSAGHGPSPHPQHSSTDAPRDPAPQPSVAFDLACQYPSCGVISKNHSEFRKHGLRHAKPYKCEVRGCSKTDGFSTNNDLDRHKKSVHKIMPKNSTDRSFRCAASNCPKREKIWPRLDNFRQHCLRIHAEMDCDELVRKSEMEPGLSMQANNLDDSSNQGAGEACLGAGVNGLPNFINQNLTSDHPLSPAPVPSCSSLDRPESQKKHTHFSELNSPSFAGISANTSLFPSLIQQSDPNQWLQVPKVRYSHNSPSVPTATTSANLGNGIMPPKYPAALSRRGSKTKPMTSAKKAEAVSEELASEIAKIIDLYRGPREDIQATIKSRLLLTFNPGLSSKRSAQIAALKDDLNQNKKRRITCDQCPTTTARLCDMSKNDWKRHENTQHYQIETWRCQEHSTTSALGQCARIFYRREQFQGHLREKHGLENEDQIREQSKSCRIGRNGQSTFWCGFCRKIVELKMEGLDAWEERFSHIDNQHYKGGQTICDWVPLDSDIPKGVAERETMAESERADDDDDYRGDSGSSDDDGDGDSSKGTPSADPSPSLRGDGATYSTDTCTDGQSGRTGKATPDKRVMIWECVSPLHAPGLVMKRKS
ncbi:MAG: hypothetical protein LQ348_004834 [Seirophora lacunosa]|nr:MAG: hypothetical protein LQ348_004834 [Seirophora lacunosa]